MSRSTNNHMSFEDFLAVQNSKEQKPRSRHNDEEHRIQCACIRWFRLQYPKLQNILFAIPNGGSRDKITATKLKAEGVVAGVADIILLKSNRYYGALCIEMKTADGRQTEKQKQWQKVAETTGNKYVVCRSLDDFMRIIKEYISDM